MKYIHFKYVLVFFYTLTICFSIGLFRSFVFKIIFYIGLIFIIVVSVCPLSHLFLFISFLYLSSLVLYSICSFAFYLFSLYQIYFLQSFFFPVIMTPVAKLFLSLYRYMFLIYAIFLLPESLFYHCLQKRSAGSEFP